MLKDLEEININKKPLKKDLEDVEVVVLGRQVDRGPLHLVLLVHDLGEGEIISVFRWQVYICYAYIYIYKWLVYIFLWYATYLCSTNAGQSGGSDLVCRLPPQIVMPTMIKKKIFFSK